MAYKVALDTCVLDWLLEGERLEQLERLRENAGVTAIVTAEVAQEVGEIPDAPEEKRIRKERLQALIREHFWPIEPTLIPVAGIARAGAMRAASPRAKSLRAEAYRVGLRQMDTLHVVNAACHGCDAFVTVDERLLKKRRVVREVAGVTLLRPEALATEVGS